VDVRLRVEQLPEAIRAAPGEAMFDREGSAQPLDLLGAVRPIYAVEAAGGSRDEMFEAGHRESPCCYGGVKPSSRTGASSKEVVLSRDVLRLV
jgi:hypothetical protein